MLFDVFGIMVMVMNDNIHEICFKLRRVLPRAVGE